MSYVLGQYTPAVVVVTNLQYGRSSFFCEDPISPQYVFESEQNNFVYGILRLIVFCVPDTTVL